MDYKIEMLNITKKFGPLIANDDITLRVKPGEIHGLLGENGAGKSTLMSILFGLYTQDEGVIKIDGELVDIKNPNDATNLKIGMVHQHFKLVPVFSVAESIILGNEPNKLGFLNMKECEKKIKDLSLKYHLEVDPKAKIKDLSVGMQQRVEILKMLYRDANILIFDEPTAVLTPQEIQQLIGIMKNFAKQGKTIIIITHKLNEIKQVADRCTILRKGKSIATINVKDTSIGEMASMMVGRDVNLVLDKPEHVFDKTLLDVKNLNVFSKALNKDVVKNISFDIKQGEVVAIAGVEGNGQSELIKALWGLEPIEKTGKISRLIKDYIKDSFSISDLIPLKVKYEDCKNKYSNNKFKLWMSYIGATFNFKHETPIKVKYQNSKKDWLEKKNNKTVIMFKDIDITNYSIRQKIELGMSHIPEDRHKHALVLDYTLEDNMILDSYYKEQFSKYGWLKRKNITNYCEKLSQDYDIRSSMGTKSIARGMSGGNQQKAVLAREVSLHPDLLIAVQPTRGLDIGAIEYMHKALLKHREENKSILLVSYELDEIINLADRILVMYEGQIVANILTKNTNKQELGQYMLGARKDG